MAQLIDLLFYACQLLLLARIILGFVVPYMGMQGSGAPDGLVRVYEVVFGLTEPVLGPIRRILPSTGMIDFSPLVVMVILVVIHRVLLAIVT